MEVSGEVGVVEAQRAGHGLAKHLYGKRRFAPWLAFPVYVAVMIAAAQLSERIAPGAGIAGILLISGLGFWAWVAWWRNATLQAWRRRGVLDQVTAVYRIEPDSLVIDWSQAHTRLAWSSVSQIAPAREGWIVIGPGLAYLLPARLFADASAQQAFLAACLARMKPEAAARSVQPTVA